VSSLKDSFKDAMIDTSEPLAKKAIVRAAHVFLNLDIKGIADVVPVVQWVRVVGKVYEKANQFLRVKKMQAFLCAIGNDQADLTAFLALPENAKQDLRAFVIVELEKQTTEHQAIALGFLLIAHLQGKVGRLLFMGVAHEIKSTNPMVFAFNVDSFRLSSANDRIEVGGPLHYLPKAFFSEIQLWDDKKSYLSEPGKIFFDLVYEPMRQSAII